MEQKAVSKGKRCLRNTKCISRVPANSKVRVQSPLLNANSQIIPQSSQSPKYNRHVLSQPVPLPFSQTTAKQQRWTRP